MVLLGVLMLASFTLWRLERQTVSDAQSERHELITSVAQSGPKSSPADHSGLEAASEDLNPTAALPLASAQPLFTYTQPADATVLDRALPAPAQAIHYVRLNAALFTAKDSPFWQQPGVGRVEIPLPNGSALSVVIVGTNSMGPDRFTSTGSRGGRTVA